MSIMVFLFCIPIYTWAKKKSLKGLRDFKYSSLKKSFFQNIFKN